MSTPEIDAFLDDVMPERRKTDARRLDGLFREVTGWTPRLWSPGIVGYGAYDYTYASGRSGTALATGFAPRKANMVVYIMPGYADFADILEALGPYKKGKACLYLGALSKVDESALRRLIRAGLDDLATRWTITPT